MSDQPLNPPFIGQSRPSIWDPVLTAVKTVGGGALAGIAYLGAGLTTAVGLWLITNALSPGVSAETQAWWHNYETCGGGGCYASGNAIDAGDGSLSFDRPSVGTIAGASGDDSGYGYTPGYYPGGSFPGGYRPKRPAMGTPPAYNFAAAEAARKKSQAATEAIGNANNARTAADATGGSGGTGGPPTTTGFANPDDDWVSFGQNANQIYHTFRHTDQAGIARESLSDIIREHLRSAGGAVRLRQVFNGTVNVGDQKLSYSAFRLTLDHINVSSIRILQ